MNAVEQFAANKKVRLGLFFERNYKDYYGILIFTPVDLSSEFMEEANRIWLIKNHALYGDPE